MYIAKERVMSERILSRESQTRLGVDIRDFPPEQRMLLLPHCLRPSQGCPGKMTPQGLVCEGCTRTDCQIQPIRDAATNAGYLDVCVAPGGRLAVKRVAEVKPAVIVAVACDKELAEGVAAVRSLGWDQAAPPVIQIPLLMDGCVETKVDLDQVIGVIQH
jgi:geranylgeranyl diphosphate synthase, type II